MTKFDMLQEKKNETEVMFLKKEIKWVGSIDK